MPLPDLDLAQASVHNTPWFATYSRKSGASDGLQAARSRGPAAVFVQANGLRLPFGDETCASASDILCFTHIPVSRQPRYLAELHHVLRAGGRALLVLFSTADEHFYGHPVSTEYTFRFDPTNPLMARYEHYQGMLNVHFDHAAVLRAFGDWFKIEEAVELAQPVYSHRKLWKVVVRKLA